jgi:glycosyltransferase involved in cell wall biosynthesis
MGPGPSGFAYAYSTRLEKDGMTPPAATPRPSAAGSWGVVRYELPIAHGDITAFVKPIALIGRMPDATGISQHLLSLYRAVGDAIQLVTYDLHDQATVQTLAWDWPRYSAIIVTESVVHDPDLILLLRRLAGHLPRVLVLAWDSDVLDPAEVGVLNQAFDTVLATSELLSRSWAKQVAPHVQWANFPLNLDLRARAAGVQPRARRSWSPVVVGSVAAFHPRKRHRLVIDIVADLVAEGENVELLLHSNLAHANGYEETRDYALHRLGERALVTGDDKTPQQMSELYRHLDVFISLSQGETYNIPVRDALASGIPCVLSDIPGHADLVGLDGVVGVPARLPVPALYPERDNRIAGTQYQCSRDDAKRALKTLVRQVREGLGPDPFLTSRAGLRSDFRLKGFDMLDVLRESGAVELRPVRATSEPRSASIGTDAKVLEPAQVSVRATARTSSFADRRRLVLVGHDAGFFSLYNTYASHVAWWEASGRAGYDEVLADWSARAVRAGAAKESFESFCYVAEDEGNLFFQLFENPYPDQNYGAHTALDKLPRVECLTDSFNAKLDPYLTYKHASKLYRGLGFTEWRARMNRVVNRVLRPRVEIQEVVQKLRAPVPDGCPTLSLHVRHPSHAMEQADLAIAGVRDFVHVAHGWMAANPDGYVLLATDQDSVVREFGREFGERVVFREGVARTTETHDATYLTLDPKERLDVGHQIQHLTAEQPDLWSSQFAKDVVIDALFLATGDTLVHTTSNVATAVAMQNPGVRMLSIRSGDTWDDVRARAFLEQRVQVV